MDKSTNIKPKKLTYILIVFLLLTISNSCVTTTKQKSTTNINYVIDTTRLLVNEIEIVDSNILVIFDSLILSFENCRTDKGQLQSYIVISDLIFIDSSMGKAIDFYITNNAEYPKPEVNNLSYYGGMMYKNIPILYNLMISKRDSFKTLNSEHKWYILTKKKIVIDVYNKTVPYLYNSIISYTFTINKDIYTLYKKTTCNKSW